MAQSVSVRIRKDPCLLEPWKTDGWYGVHMTSDHVCLVTVFFQLKREIHLIIHIAYL